MLQLAVEMGDLRVRTLRFGEHVGELAEGDDAGKGSSGQEEG